MWDKIVIWTENKGTRKAKDIIDALENGSDGYYIVCDSEKKVWGAGGSVRNACIDVVQPICNQNSNNEAISSEFYEDDFEVWSLLPAHQSLYKSFIETEKANLKIRQERGVGHGLDDLLICKTICLEVNEIAILKGLNP